MPNGGKALPECGFLAPHFNAENHDGAAFELAIVHCAIGS